MAGGWHTRGVQVSGTHDRYGGYTGHGGAKHGAAWHGGAWQGFLEGGQLVAFPVQLRNTHAGRGTAGLGWAWLGVAGQGLGNTGKPDRDEMGRPESAVPLRELGASRLRASVERFDTDGELLEIVQSDAEIVRSFWTGERPANWPDRFPYPLDPLPDLPVDWVRQRRIALGLAVDTQGTQVESDVERKKPALWRAK